MYVVDLGSVLAVLILAGLVAGYIGWALLVARGVRYRPVLLGILTASYVLLFLFVETGSWIALLDVAAFNLTLLAVAGALAFTFSVRMTRILYDSKGRPGYRGNAYLVIAWLVILLAEIFVQQLILGDVTILHLVVIRGFPSPTSVNPTSIDHPRRVVLATIDALFAVSTGAALGNNAGIFWVFGRARRPKPREAIA